MKNKKNIIEWVSKKQKELGVGLIIRMIEAHSTKGKIETIIKNSKGKWLVETTIKKLKT